MTSAANITSGATILVVDNDPGMRQQLQGVFNDAGYRTLAVSDAPAALRLLHKENCDLVILDLVLPGVDGLALCRLLRAQAATSKLPLVVLSSSLADETKVDAFAAGADDFIAKPSTPAELLSRVGSHLRAAQREWELIGSNRDLRFLADLGKDLLRVFEPDQLVKRVAGAVYAGTSAALCAAFVNLAERNPAACVFDREG